MLSYIIRRLLLMIPTLIGITAVVFFIMAASPGGVGGSLLDQMGEMEPGQAKAIRDYYNKRYGLDKPAYVQYGRWLNQISPIGYKLADTEDGSYELGEFGFKQPDLGKSFSKSRPVIDLFAEALPITLLLNLVTIPIIYAIAIITGVYSARHRGKFKDVATGVILLGLWSIPTIWAGVMLIGFLANREYVKLFPTGGLMSTRAGQMTFLPTGSFMPQLLAWIAATIGGLLVFQTIRRVRDPHAYQSSRTTVILGAIGIAALIAGLFVVFGGIDTPEIGPLDHGYLLDRVWHLILPVACMTYGGFAFLSKIMRSSLLENLSADFVRTARAKGVSDGVVLWSHAFRNSLIPLITVAASIMPALLGGSVVIEKIFSIQGMGHLTIDAVFTRDREIILASALISGAITLVSILIADLCYAIADPRVSYD